MLDGVMCWCDELILQFEPCHTHIAKFLCTYSLSAATLVQVYTLLTSSVAWIIMLWLKTMSVGIPLLLKPWREFQNFSDTGISGLLIDLANCQYLELALCHYPQARLKTPVFERESWCPDTVFWYNLGYIVGFELVEMAISTYPKLTIYRNL